MAIPDRLEARIANAAPQFHIGDRVRCLEVDADSLIYKAAATTRSLEAAKRKFISEALVLQFCANAELMTLHLTPKHCLKGGRFNIKAVKPYQGNRKAGNKPPLVEPLRYAVGRERLELPPEVSIIFNDVLEADDSVVMACNSDPDAIFYSEDKDLNCLTNRRLCQHSLSVLPSVSGLGYLEMKELSSSKKLDGRGPVFFWAQMLMGDAADNVRGLLKIGRRTAGAVSAYESLLPFLTPPNGESNRAYVTPTTTEADIAKHVLGLYEAIGQNPLPEGWLMWLYPKEGYTFWKHLVHLGLTKGPEGAWLRSQVKLDWFNKD